MSMSSATIPDGSPVTIAGTAYGHRRHHSLILLLSSEASFIPCAVSGRFLASGSGLNWTGNTGQPRAAYSSAALMDDCLVIAAAQSSATPGQPGRRCATGIRDAI